jgi:DNA primase catalytic subunit
MFPREHLLLLHQSVIHSSFIAEYVLLNYSLENQLEMWEYRTLIDDKQIINIDELSPYMLVVSLYRRGLYLHLNEMGKVLEFEQTNLLNQIDKKSSKSNETLSIDEQILNDWRLLLKQWINIHQKLSKFNPISTSFLLHISPLLTSK